MRIRPPHQSGGFYHVMLRGNRKQDLFRDHRDYQHLNRLIARSLDRYGSEVHAFCWMPNHLHLLLRVNEIPLHRTVHYFATLYARYFNFRHDLVGHLFQGRYKSRMVATDGYFLQLLRYIHRNPVDGGLTDDVLAYPWSSMRAYAGLGHLDWLTTDCSMGYFGGNPLRLRRFVQRQAESFDPWADLDYRGFQWKPANPAKDCDIYKWQDFDQLVAGACEHFDVTVDCLRGPSSGRLLTLARSWIGEQAMRSGVATLSESARWFGRTPGALSQSIKRNALLLKEERLTRSKT